MLPKRVMTQKKCVENLRVPLVLAEIVDTFVVQSVQSYFRIFLENLCVPLVLVAHPGRRHLPLPHLQLFPLCHTLPKVVSSKPVSRYTFLKITRFNEIIFI